MKRILFFYPNLQSGGTENVIRQLIPELEDNYHVYAATLKYDPLVKIKTVQENVRWNGNTIFRYFWAWLTLYRLVSKYSFEKIIAFGEVPIFLCYLLKLVHLNVSIISCVRNSEKTHFRRKKSWLGWLKLYLFIRALKKSDAISVNSNALGSEVQSYYAGLKTETIPNPIDAKYFRSKVRIRDDIRLRILNVGRLVEQKNQIDLLKLMKRLQSANIDVSLSIYGEGEMEATLKEYVSENKIGNVHFNNFFSDLAVVYQDHDIFALTSLWEGSPNALAEAMASGMAVISYDCPTGPGELITSGENGFLIHTGCIDELELTVKQLISSKKLTDEIGEAAFITAERYKVENVIYKWRRLIEQA